MFTEDNKWLKRARELEREIIAYRRELHSIPELGFEEVKTSKKIKDYLDDMGIESSYVGGTGLVALIQGDRTCNYDDGGKEPVACLRADIDAMPAREDTGLSFKSVHDYVMHSCGHDGHAAILLGVAKLLKEYKKELKGKVKLIFQPAEELVQGAKEMIKEGVLENPEPDYILGLHLWQPLETGKLGLKKGEMMASTDNFKVRIKGKEAHGAMPHQGIDPISVSAEFIQGIYHILARTLPAEENYVLSFGKIAGGTKGNVLASGVEIDGTYRCFEEKTRIFIKEKIENLLESKKNLYGTDWEYILESFTNPTYNDYDLTEKIVDSLQKVVLAENIFMPYGPVFPSEDFSEYAKIIPGTFFFLGAGGKGEETYDYPHHHPRFDLDENALSLGVALLLQSVEDLNK